jgi:endonuclease/exonuclease/phosphatase family metal-dependent hydrolase
VAALRRGEFTGGEPVSEFVLLLQEVYRAGAVVPVITDDGIPIPGRIRQAPPTGSRQDIVSTARALGLSLYYAPSMRNGRERAGEPAEDRGNAILSTLPLSEFMAIELPFERQRRVALAATVAGVDADGAPWRLRVVSSHLDASAGANRLWLFASGLRARQAQSLADALDDGVPTVLGSDLNTWSDGPHESAVATLLRAFPDSPAPPMRPTFRSGAAQFALDYVLFRLPARWRADARRLDDRFGSDHYPLLSRLGLRE